VQKYTNTKENKDNQKSYFYSVSMHPLHCLSSFAGNVHSKQNIKSQYLHGNIMVFLAQFSQTPVFFLDLTFVPGTLFLFLLCTISIIGMLKFVEALLISEIYTSISKGISF